jgi:hypothetical protein
MSSLPEKVFLSGDALFQELDGEGVILDLRSSSYFGVDGVGVRLWQLLQDDECLDKAINQLLKEFDISPEQLTKDINKFIEELEEEGLATLE